MLCQQDPVERLLMFFQNTTCAATSRLITTKDVIPHSLKNSTKNTVLQGYFWLYHPHPADWRSNLSLEDLVLHLRWIVAPTLGDCFDGCSHTQSPHFLGGRRLFPFEVQDLADCLLHKLRMTS